MALYIRKKIGSTLIFAAAFFYISFHTLNGEQGLYALVAQQHRKDRLAEELAGVREERLALEHRVRLMRDDSVDVDMLDEQARRVLGLAGTGEMLVLPADMQIDAR